MTDDKAPEEMTVLEGVQALKGAFAPDQLEELEEDFSPSVIAAMGKVYEALVEQETEILKVRAEVKS